MTYDEWKANEPDPTVGYQPTLCDCGAQLTWTGRQWVEMTECTCEPRRCPDCGEPGETAGHMTCQYPEDRP